MSIYVIGVNFKTAPVSVREQIYFADDKLSLYLQDITQSNVADEAMLLSTCNRSELYCKADDVNRVCDWFCSQTTLSRQELDKVMYVYQDSNAIKHMMEVACGIDSMVVGEPQILGQMKQAFSESCAAGSIQSDFHRLMQQVFMVAKEIRSMTDIGACPVSVASAAIRFAKSEIVDFSKANIVLVGAGDTTELMLRYLKTNVSAPVSIVNRSLENAAALLGDMEGQIYGLDQLPLALSQADVVFTATGSAQPIVTAEVAVQAIAQRLQNNPILILDIAVPRDVDPSVHDVEGVNLYCIDHLKDMIEANRKGREHASDKAREMIADRSQECLRALETVDHISHTISAYRGQIEDICHSELAKAKMRLAKGDCPEAVLNLFAHSFTNKLLHEPSVQLRQAGKEGRFELLKFAKELFGINDPEIKLS